jgi:Trypsin-like peptidase domain
MAIVLPHGRPAIDIVKGSYATPTDEWAHLGDPEPRARLEAAIASVGRVDYIGHPFITFDGSAFVVGKNLLLIPYIDTLQRNGNPYTFKPGQSAAVDFGHEREPTDSLRVQIEEVIGFDTQFSVGLARATLPDTMTPLILSALDPDALGEREVALVGYPAFDQRNDTALMHRIFREVFEVKRLLPGRLRGSRPYTLSGKGEVTVLGHDCLSTGGCGNAPLVDVLTGNVVGLHFAGRFLDVNYAIPTSALAENPTFVDAGVQFAGIGTRKSRRGRGSRTPQPVETPAAAELPEPRPDVRTTDSDKMPVDAAPEADAGVQLVVLTAERPALLYQDWRNEVTEGWRKLLTTHEKRLDLVARSVGKLVTDAAGAWTASAFVVGDRLALTASFATESVAEGAGARAVLRPGSHVAIDFSDALGVPAERATTAVTAIKFIHPFFSVALLELERLPDGVGVVDLASQIPSELSGREIAVLSFAGHADDGSEDLAIHEALYKHRWGRLFVQPGMARQVGQMSEKGLVPALVHDCSTTVGSAGAPVLDLGTGYVIGVHTHASFLDSGFAQPTWELARDPKVWQYAIGFRPDPRPLWLDSWNDAAPQQSAPIDVTPQRRSRWTVDDVPIDWSRQEPKEMERLLLSIDAQMALYSAENAGLQLGTVNSAQAPMYLWREIIKKASNAGVLRRLLEELAAAPQNQGIAPKLRGFL